MTRHTFAFNGGENLTTMGAAWFVSFSYYDKIDKSHTNWKSVSTYKSRMSVYTHTVSYHTYWLRQIIQMNENNLEKNTIGLTGRKVIDMAKELLGIK